MSAALNGAARFVAARQSVHDRLQRQRHLELQRALLDAAAEQLFRAMIDRAGLGALPKNVAIYPFALTDRSGATLDASKRYVVHLHGPRGAMPRLPFPKGAFWSLTLYDSDGLFVDNPLDRYLVNDRSDLHYNANGSLDIYVHAERPTDPKQAMNWLPTPASGAFQLMRRIYGTPVKLADGAIDGSGWKAGTILPCTPSGATPAFPPSGIAAPIACAG